MKPTAEQRKIAAENGISYETLLRRLAEDWPMNQAINISVNAHRVLTDEDIQMAAENGISYGTLYTRVTEYGWEVDKAINTPIIPRNKRAKEQESRIPTELKKRAKENGIPLTVVYKRLFHYEWSEEKAVTHPVRKPRMLLTDEQKQKAIENNINRSTIYSRIVYHGWNAEDAVSIPVNKNKKTS